MDNDYQSEDGQNSLSDGAYEIISQSSFHTSDNESQDDGNESLLSFGIPTPEEGSSVNGDDYITSQNADYAQEFLYELDDVQHNRVQQRGMNSLNNSPRQRLTSSVTVTASEDDWIKFEQSTSNELNNREGGNQDNAIETESNPTSRARIIIRKTLSRSLLKLNGPFRIKFCATNSEACIKEAVLEKIGQALHLSTISNRANQSSTKEKLSIVPISAFGADGTAPEVMLLRSTGLQIEVEDCSGSALCTSADNNISVAKSEMPIEAMCRSTQNYQMPDLVIFIHRNLLADHTELMLDFARSEQLKMHGVPVIDICGDLPYNESLSSVLAKDMQSLPYLNFRPSKERAVHMAYEIIDDSRGSFLSFATPLDHQTFQRMEPQELNRNIAAIIRDDFMLKDSLLKLLDVQCLAISYVKAVWLQLLALMALLVQSCKKSIARIEVVSRFIEGNCVRPNSKQLRAYFARFRKDALVGLAVGLTLYSLLWCYHRAAVTTAACHSADVATPTAIATTSKQIMWQARRQTLPGSAAPPLLSGTSPEEDVALTSGRPETALSVVPLSQKLSSKSIPKTVSKPKLFEAEDGRLFLKLINAPARKWRPAEPFIYAFHQGEMLDVPFNKISDDTFELHLTRIHFCAPVVLAVSRESVPGYDTFHLPSPCGLMLVSDSLVKTYLDLRSRMAAMGPKLGETVYQRALGFSYETTQGSRDSYKKYIPSVSSWSRMLFDQMQKFAQNGNDGRLAVVTKVAEHSVFLTDRITNMKEVITENIESHFSLGRRVLNSASEALYSGARQLHKVNFLKGLHDTPLPRAAPLTVRVARARAVVFKDRIASKGAHVQHWVGRAQRRLYKLARRRSGKLTHGSKWLKRCCRVNRKKQSN